MYMFTQKESQYTAQLLWHDWFPSVWLDEHQQGSKCLAHGNLLVTMWRQPFNAAGPKPATNEGPAAHK